MTDWKQTLQQEDDDDVQRTHQAVWHFEGLIAGLAGVGPLVAVQALVPAAARGGVERLIAHPTLVRLLPRVNTYVGCQVPLWKIETLTY